MVGLHALFYALQNIANISAAHASLVYVMSGADHEAYPATMFFKTDNPGLAWAALIVIVAGQFAAAFFGIKGGWDLFRARMASNEQFNKAKRAGIIAAGFAQLVWFGLFMAFGAAFFQMWQTQIGANSMNGAFMYAIASVVSILFVCMTDD